MGQQWAYSSSTYATLLASNYSRKGYGFAGWSEDQDAAQKLNRTTATNPDDPTATVIYGPQEQITLKSDHAINGLSLYAIWVPSAGTLQNWTCPDNITMPIGSVTALTDQRDSQTYAIAKLADGKCWMIENLRLEAENTMGQNRTDPSVTNESLAQGYGSSETYGNFTGLATAENENFTNTTPPAANSLYSANGSTPNVIKNGDYNFRYSRMPRYNNTNTQNRAVGPTDNGNNIYIYGNYYTWAAAVADVSQYGTKGQSVANASLCPAGWRLPKGGDKESESDNDFWTLIVTNINNGIKPANYDNAANPYYEGTSEAGPIAASLLAYPNNLLYSGYFRGSSVTSTGSFGQYWTSTVSSNIASFDLYFNVGRISPGTTSWDKYQGGSIGCIASTT